MNLKLFILIVGCMLMPSGIYAGINPATSEMSPAQNGRTVICIVQDELGEVAGANVTVKGTTNGNITDVDGKAVLQNVAPNSTLVISYVGYATKEINIGNQTTVNITITEDTQNLEEVVVVGYGTQKKVNLTGAVEQVTSKDLTLRPTTNLTQSLEGAVPNLSISLSDGKPTRSSSYQVRGTGSIGQEGSALILIDGVEGDPQYLNPNDVESVSVLKDAASAAVYGARAAFGVVLITTKNPNKERTTVTYNGSFFVKEPTFTPDLITDAYEWSGYFIEAYRNYSGTYPGAVHSWIPFSEQYYNELANHRPGMNAPEVTVGADGKYTYYGNTDWFDELYKDSFIGTEHNLSVQGGGEKADFLVSGRFYTQDGIFTYNTDKYHTYNVRAKGSVKPAKWIKFTNNFEMNNKYYYNPLVSGTYGTVWNAIVNGAEPMAVMFNPDGTLTRNAAASVGAMWYGKSWQKQNTNMFRNTAGFTMNFFDNRLIINGDITYRYTKKKDDTKMVPTPYSSTQGVIAYEGTSYDFIANQNTTDQYLATNIYAEYSQSFAESHNLKFMAGYNYEQDVNDYYVIKRDHTLYPDAESIRLCDGTITSSETYYKWRIAGLFFRLNYDYKNRYLLELNGRYDGSSKFPTNQQWGFFPSASAAWRVSEESFWKVNPKAISNMKFRISYGSLGNGNVNPYAFQETFAINTKNRLQQGSRPLYVNVPGAIPASLTWETATTLNFGADLGFLNQRLNFSGDYYIRKTTDMYTVGPTLPAVFGSSSPKGNYADMTTKGWEITIGWNDKFALAGKPFHYEIRGSLGDYKSVIDKYNNDTKSLGGWPTGKTSYYEGMTLGEIWGLETLGFFKTEEEVANHADQSVLSAGAGNKYRVGDIKFADRNNNGRIDVGANTADDPGDRMIIGNTEPRYNFSLRLSADWNNFFFSSFFQGVGKQNWLQGDDNALYYGLYARPYGLMPKKTAELMWTEENQDSYFPRLIGYVGAAWNRELCANQSKYIENIAYIRLKNVQLGYNLPQALVQKMHLQRMGVYISIDNVFSWSPLYKHENSFDVQSIKGEDSESLAIINNGWWSNYTSETPSYVNNYPILRTYSVGLSITF